MRRDFCVPGVGSGIFQGNVFRASAYNCVSSSKQSIDIELSSRV